MNYKNTYEPLILVSCIMGALILGVFINIPWLNIPLNIIGILAVVKFIFITSPKNMDAYINELLPEHIDVGDQQYFRYIFHYVSELDSYWCIEYSNQDGDYLPDLNDRFVSDDYGNNIPLEIFVNIVHIQLKSYHYV